MKILQQLTYKINENLRQIELTEKESTGIYCIHLTQLAISMDMQKKKKKKGKFATLSLGIVPPFLFLNDLFCKRKQCQRL